MRYSADETIKKELSIRLLHTGNCQGYHQATDALEEALAALDLSPQFEIIRIDTQEAAEQHRFFASPAIYLNGKDIEEKARISTQIHADIFKITSNTKVYGR